MVNGLFNIKEFENNLKKTPYSLFCIFFWAQLRGILDNIFNFRESEKNLKMTPRWYFFVNIPPSQKEVNWYQVDTFSFFNKHKRE